jgi:hypothetical protein
MHFQQQQQQKRKASIGKSEKRAFCDDDINERQARE